MSNNESKKKVYDSDFEDYISFLRTNIPNCLFIEDQNNKELFLKVNTAFKACDILTYYEFVKPDKNYYNLLIEYKMYFARILPAICLNDKFLIDNILRLLTEKLYRILTGISYPARGERRIRTDSRKNMNSDLTNLLSVQNKSRIDKLYNDLSELIHHTESTPVDLYDIRKIFSTDLNLSKDIGDTIEILTDIFIEEILLKICRDNLEICGTNFLVNIENNLPTIRVNQIRLYLNL